MPLSPDQDILRNLGIHRVIEPKGCLPQPAWKLDNTPAAYPSETLIDVHALHIDSASFAQIASVCERDPERMRQHILGIIVQRGKLHNPVPSSGCVLIGTIHQLDATSAEIHGLSIRGTLL